MIRAMHELPPAVIAQRLAAAGFARSKEVVRKHIHHLGLEPHGRLAARARLLGLTPDRLRGLTASGAGDRAIARLYPAFTAKQIWRLRRQWKVAAGGQWSMKAMPAAATARNAAAASPGLAAVVRMRPRQPGAVPRTIWNSTLQTFLPDDDALAALYAGRSYALEGRIDPRLLPAAMKVPA